MTTESAPAPRAAQATAVRRAAAVIRPPRGGGKDARVPRTAGAATRRRAPAALVVSDVLALGLAVALAGPGRWPPVVVLLLLPAVQLLLHAWRGLYRPGLSPSALAELPALAGLAAVQWYAVAGAVAAYDSRHAAGWAALGCAAGVQAVVGCGARAVVHRFRMWSAARDPQSALVIGDGPVAGRVVAVLQEHTRYGMRPVGRVVGSATDAEEAADGPARQAPLPVLASVQDAARAVVQNSVRHAVFTAPPEVTPDGAELFALFARHGCRVWLITDQGTGTECRTAPRPDHVWGFAAHSLHPRHRPAAYRVKRAMDAVLAVVALVAASPVMGACALAVRVCDGPGVIFRQERVGEHGRSFVLLKFRTLRPGDAHESATRWNVSADRRMSRVGRMLRRTSLDELPQLWNVVRGDMSLVGPRPERPYFVAQFSRLHPGYRSRHRMPVGITGLAQVHGLRGDTSIEDRARFDNRYIETWSLWQDVCVLARTAGSVFRLGGS